MQPQAIDKARRHLALAEEAYRGLGAAKSFAQLELHWSRFLEESHRVFSKLEKGSKGTGRSPGWFGMKKNQRRTDPLLRYVHHARNSDEHGIADIVSRKAQGWKHTFDLTEDDSPVEIQFEKAIDERGEVHVRNMRVVGPHVTNDRLEIVEPRITLLAVYDDRYKDTFYPPDSHLGEPLASATPKEVARLCLDYMAQMLEEAESLRAASITR